MKIFVAVLISLVAAIMFFADASLVSGGNGTVGWVALLLVLGLSSYFCIKAPTGKKAFARGCFIYAVGAFLLPIASLIFGAIETAAVEGDMEQVGAALGTGIIVILSFVWAFSTGVAAVVLGFFLGRE